MANRDTNRAPIPQTELKIEKWVYGGDGLGRLDGRAVLVPFVLPGETVRVTVVREKPGLIDAALDRITVPAAERVEPACPWFMRCGGCHYQHAGYAAQLAWKREVLREVFRRVGKLEAPEEIELVASPEWGYRNRAQFHLDGGRIGYQEAGSHRLCPVDHCPVSSPRVNEALAALREMMQDRRFPRFVRSLELFTNEEQVQLNILETHRPLARQFFDWCAERIPGAAGGTLDYPAAGFTYRVGHRSFFQVNRFLIDRLVECALAGAGGNSAVDLYAGVGLFSLPLTRRFQSVTSVESGAGAVRDLEFNAARAGVEVAALRMAAEDFLGGLATPPDFLLADPPRAGLGKGVVRHLLRLKPRRLAIVACDPATLSRDLAPLVAEGYRIEGITLIDLFPETYHIETVTRLAADS